MGHTYSITYDIVTEESSQDGDTAENGFMVGDTQRPLDSGPISRYKYETQITEEDWTGGWNGESLDHANVRAMAEAILHLPHDCIEPSCSPWQPGSWYSLYVGSDDQWTAETEDGTCGTRTLAVHLDGWTPEEEEIIFKLVTAGDPEMEILR